MQKIEFQTKLVLPLFISFLFTIFCFDLFAQCTTNSVGTWTANGNWSTCSGVFPNSAGASVVIAHDMTLNLTSPNTSINVNNLTVNANRTLTITGSGTLTVNGNTSILGNGGKIIISGNIKLIIKGNLDMDNQTDFVLSGGAFVDVKGNFNSANNGSQVNVDGSGTGGSFLVRGCYIVGGGQPIPNIFSPTALLWCINGSCASGNNSASGSGVCVTLLPITLVSFSGRLVELNGSQEKTNATELTWVTANETDNEFFTVQRSADGVIFEDVSQLSGAGTTKLSRTYKTYDYTPFEGITYYRLKQTDYGDTFSYSKLIKVTTFTNLTIYPNPLSVESKQLTIHLKNTADNNFKISIVDINGKIIYSRYTDRLNGSVYAITLPDLIVKGIYFAHIELDSHTITHKFFIL